MEIRYVGDGDGREVAPAGHPAFTVTRLDWVDVPREVVGRRPKGKPGNDTFDPGEGLLGQVEWNEDGTFEPLWETRAAKRSARTRAENETTDDDVTAAEPAVDVAAVSGEEE